MIGWYWKLVLLSSLSSIESQHHKDVVCVLRLVCSSVYVFASHVEGETNTSDLVLITAATARVGVVVGECKD